MPQVHSIAAAQIGKRVRALRQRLGISLVDLGDLSEISWTSIGKIERGVSSPTVETVVRLAGALGVDPSVLVEHLTPEDYGRRAHAYSARDFVAERRKHEGRGGPPPHDIR